MELEATDSAGDDLPAHTDTELKEMVEEQVHVYTRIPRYRKRLPTPKVNKLRSPKLRLTQSLLVATVTQNFMRFRCRVIEKRVCVTTFTMPVYFNGTNFVPFLLLTRRCYDAETSTILLLLKRAFA